MDFLQEYKRLKAKGFPISDETINFVTALGKSDDVGTHFDIYCMEMQCPRQERGFGIYEEFSMHGRAGGEYLLARLDDEESIAINAAYLLSSYRVEKVCHFNAEEKATILRTLTRLAESPKVEIRRRSLIAIGWVGTVDEVEILNRHLLTDEDALCRAWSASSFLQMGMSKRIACDILQTKTRDSLIKCLKSETNAFTKGVVVEAIQTVWDISFGLRAAAVDALKVKSIEKASAKALQYLEQSHD